MLLKRLYVVEEVADYKTLGGCTLEGNVDKSDAIMKYILHFMALFLSIQLQ